MRKHFSLSKKQASHLKVMLPRTRRSIDLPGLLTNLERIGDRYQQAVARLGCWPILEDMDRCLAFQACARRRMAEKMKMNQRQEDRLYARIERADQELFRLCTDTAKVWKAATGRKLPGWPGSIAKETKRDRKAVASRHPLGLMLDALDVYVAVATLSKLAKYGRNRAENDSSRT